MRPRGLIGLAEDTLDYSQGEMKQVFDVLVHGETYPALVHCTQGKDRTGLVILLVLLSAGVSGEVISGDYSKSEAELVVEFEERMKEIRALGLDEEYTKCPDGFTGAVQEHLERKYGGVEGYLKSLGVERESLVRLRERLMV